MKKYEGLWMFDCEFIELSDSQAPPDLQGVRLPRQGPGRPAPAAQHGLQGGPRSWSPRAGAGFSQKPLGKAVSSRDELGCLSGCFPPRSLRAISTATDHHRLGGTVVAQVPL